MKKNRRLLALLLAAAMALSLLAGCGPKQETPSGSEEPEDTQIVLTDHLQQPI